jgi:chromosome segregation ATPase
VAKLMDAMTKELKEQRTLTVSFKSRAQLANTKSKQMSRRLEDMQVAIDVTQQKSHEIMNQNQKLEQQVAALEVEVASKQVELDDCEMEEKAMTSEHQRLETFRFVLKAKANDMEDEKVPLQKAVVRLEEAKLEANEVLITEFASKAKAAQKLEEMQKIESSLTHDVKEVNATVFFHMFYFFFPFAN